MRILLVTFVAVFVGLFYNTQSAKDDEFQKDLQEGFNRLKSVPNEGDTVKLLQELHKMEGEIENQLSQAPQRLPPEIVSHWPSEVHHISQMGDTIEEVNHKSKVDAALFQGDMLLTKTQAKEILEDIKANKGNRSKRQAFRDSRYPGTLWKNNNVYYSFGRNATEAAKRLLKKAMYIWSTQTCISFGESVTGVRKI